jgi:hypothetical protein
MLPGIAGLMGAAGPLTLLQMIQDAGLTSNLVLCLDAADSNSYSGSGQTWTDVSGNSYNFYRGTTSSSQSTDPTFNGTAGNKSSSEYWSFDGADLFTETTNHGFDTGWHKNNGVFTIVAAVDLPSAADAQVIFGNFGDSDPGVSLSKLSSADGRLLRFRSWTSSGTALAITTSAAVPDSSWAFLAVALNEATGANGATLQINSTQESFTSTYTSPSSSSPLAAKISGDGSSSPQEFASGARLGGIMAWSSRLSDANLNTLYALLGARYGF